MPVHDSGNSDQRNAEPFGHRSVCNAAGRGFPDKPNRIIVQFGAWVPRALAAGSMKYAVPAVLSSGPPGQIAKAIIGVVPIQMTALLLGQRYMPERFQNEAVKQEGPAFAIRAVKADDLVAAGLPRWLHSSPLSDLERAKGLSSCSALASATTSTTASDNVGPERTVIANAVVGVILDEAVFDGHGKSPCGRLSQAYCTMRKCYVKAVNAPKALKAAGWLAAS